MTTNRFVILALSLSFLGAFAHGQTLNNRPVSPAGGTWQRTVNISNHSFGVPLLMQDGTVIMHDIQTRNWFKLSPDINGNYVNGTWSQIGSLPSGYGPLYFASAVLPDGRVVVVGGEYNLNQGAVWTNKGAIYTPSTNTWATLNGPWPQIGDAQCAVLPDGRLLLASPLDKKMAVLNSANLTWTNLNSTNKGDRFDEEGWTLLPDGAILTADAINAPHAEKYISSLDQWVSAGDTVGRLEDPGSQEVGPAVLMPNGKVFATGATGFNSIYTPGNGTNDPGSWVAGPSFPNIGGQLDIADGPACLLPNGNVLCYASPGIFNNPSYFYEFDGTNLATVPNVPNSADNPSFVGNMLMLPSGQVLFTDFSNDVEIYTPSGGPQESWRPTITSCPTSIAPGQSFQLQGRQLNGLSQCSAYGDDSTNATNYPMVRITNNATGHVTYCRAHDHSTMAVATGAAIVSTQVDVPNNVETGAATLQVVTNGIASAAFSVNIAASAVVLAPVSTSLLLGSTASGNVASLASDDNNALRLCEFIVPNQASPIIRLDATFMSPFVTATSLKVDLKSRTVNAGAFSVRAFLANVSGTDSFVYGAANQVLADTPMSTSFTLNSSGNVSATGHIDNDADNTANGTIRVRLEVVETGPVSIVLPCSEYELLNVTVTP